MRISDWSSDVCSSDLRSAVGDYPEGQFRSKFAAELDGKYRARVTAKRMFVNEHYLTLLMRPAVGSADRTGLLLKRIAKAKAAEEAVDPDELARFEEKADRKRGGEGKSVAVRVDHGG